MLFTMLPLLLAVEGGGGGITNVDRTLFVATLVLFAIFAFVLAKFGWKPLLHVIEEREKSVREAVEGAEKANAEAQSLLDKHRELVKEAGRERDEIMKRALKEAEQLKAELAATARSESEQILVRAKEQIEREKNQAIRELRGHVADLAMEAAAKIVTASLTPEAQRKLVDDFLKALPKQAS
ncbi:MAG: F0F1 ATP synthase subunit B [Acidobacteria bacterium]|nr:F0F1 ATP synthase subunit B [Acidobacteriota bacterium]